jgi:hypothetical protein
MILDLDALHKSDPSLYAAVSITIGPARGQLQVALADFPLPTRRRLSDWWVTQKELENATSTTVVDRPVPPPRDLDAELRADIQRTIDQQQGLARLEQFCVEQGLARTPENAEKVQQWLDKNLKGYWSQKGVDVAVLNLAKELIWTPKEVPPPPAEPTEVLGTLPDGTTQLPLDVDQPTLGRASKEQAKDWLKRHNAGKLVRPRGGFGSAF